MLTVFCQIVYLILEASHAGQRKREIIMSQEIFMKCVFQIHSTKNVGFHVRFHDQKGMLTIGGCLVAALQRRLFHL